MTVPVPQVHSRRPAALRLHAGHLSALFEPDTGWLRHISVGGYELIRAVYGAVRDQHWRTITPRIAALDTVVRERTFDIQFLNRCEEGDIAFAWQAHIRGTAEGQCSFRFDGEARSSFLRNRIGLCLLHPLDGCVGRSCAIEHVDGTRTESAFPELVEPHQPFLAIRSMSWQTTAGRVTVRFEGETFETEDQRNWSDASFKTYGTPVELPRPVPVPAGARVQQRIDIVIEPARTVVPVADGRVLDLEPTGDWRPGPRLGLTAGPSVEPLTPAHQALIRALAPDHLRVDIRPDGEAQELSGRVAAGARAASEIGARLQLAVLLGDDERGGLRRLAAAVRGAGAAIDTLLVLADGAATPTADSVTFARGLFVETGLARAIGAGTNRYFADLNRNRPPSELGAYPVFSLNPQVHAFDDLSIMENLEALPWMVATTRGFAEQPAVISPLSLKPRFTADAPDRVVIGPDGQPENVDPRQHGLLGAAWTLGSVAHLLPLEGVHSLTYFERTGPRGLLDGDVVFPLYHVLADLAGAARVKALRSSVPSRVVGVLVEAEGGTRLLAANLTDHAARIRVPMSDGTCRVRTLDARCLRQATTDPAAFRARGEPHSASGGRVDLELPAYATVRLDVP